MSFATAKNTSNANNSTNLRIIREEIQEDSEVALVNDLAGEPIETEPDDDND